MGDVSCRIVVVASNLEKGALLVNQIIPIKNNSSSQIMLESSAVEPVFHPWSISNRYYAADVHFALHTVSQAYGAVFEGVPAVIVAWTKGEPFEEYMATLQKAMEEHDPEVLLAVRLPREGDNEGTVKITTEKEQEDAEEDNNAVDTTLISYGFEYIDASEPYDPSSTDPSPEEGPVAAEGIPHLPRVIDALSTIMWPSMSSGGASETAPGASSRSRGAQRSQATLEAIVNRDPLAILQVLEELDSEFDFDSMDDDDMPNTELYKEAYVLSSPVSDSEDDSGVWTHSSGDNGMSNISAANHLFARTASPTSITFDDTNDDDDDDEDAFGMFSDGGQRFYLDGKKPQVSLGFEDDFTVYLSPPVDDVDVIGDDFSHLKLGSSGGTTPEHTSTHSLSPYSGPLYHSLGSSSDLNSTDDL